MEDRLEQVAIQVADISKQLSGFEARVITAVADLKDQGRINVEELKDEVKLLGEGYVATLEGIERKLSDLNTKIDTKFSDHDLVLANHNTRITKLEQR